MNFRKRYRSLIFVVAHLSIGQAACGFSFFATTVNGLLEINTDGQVSLVSDELTWGGVGSGAIDFDDNGNAYAVRGGTISKFDFALDQWSPFAALGAQTEGIRFSPNGLLYATTVNGLMEINTDGQVSLVSDEFTWGGVGSGAIDFDINENAYVVKGGNISLYDFTADQWSFFATTGAQTEGIMIIPEPAMAYILLVGGLPLVGIRFSRR